MSDINKVQTLLEWHEIGDIKLNDWEFNFLTDLVEKHERFHGDIWTENRAAKVDEIYAEKCP